MPHQKETGPGGDPGSAAVAVSKKPADGTTSCRCPRSSVVASHEGEWDTRRRRFTCRRCRLLIGDREHFVELSAELGELADYRRRLDVARLRQPDLPDLPTLRLAFSLLVTYLDADLESGDKLAELLRDRGLSIRPLQRAA